MMSSLVFDLDSEVIVLEIMFVDPFSRKIGVGSKMVEGLLEKADHLGIPTYLNATSGESEFFKKFDFKPISEWTSEGDHPMFPMKRDPHKPKHVKTPGRPVEDPYILYHSEKKTPSAEPIPYYFPLKQPVDELIKGKAKYVTRKIAKKAHTTNLKHNAPWTR
ncbi:GNAT family acetyltransferase [Zalerion maritima]|uniref:GNAT family acetyltransferase n=1 Tax=Zalerion maritima TaxID=339359 RepID=A0AAD5S0D6_9PEZI|nr:GNAT family acetyltransferase [Zalerion maritima]